MLRGALTDATLAAIADAVKGMALLFLLWWLAILAGALSGWALWWLTRRGR